MSTSPRTVLIVANPKSGAIDQSTPLQCLEERLRDRGLEVETVDSLETAEGRVRSLWSAGDLLTVVAAGGDGTVCAVANQVPAGVPVTIFPTGTENLLATYLGITADPNVVVDTIVGGRRRYMDAGKAGDRVFLVVATCGFDAHVVHKMEQIRRGHISRWTYARPIIQALWSYRFPCLRIRAHTSDGEYEHSAAWVFVFNVPRYAAGLPIWKEADPTDGYLDLCTFKRRGIFWGIWYLLRVVTRTHTAMSDFKHMRVQRVDLELDGRFGEDDVTSPTYQLDGDTAGELPVTIEVLPRRACFLVPSR